MLVVYYVFQFLLPVVVFSSFFPFGILLKVVFIKVGWRELINPAKVPSAHRHRAISPIQGGAIMQTVTAADTSRLRYDADNDPHVRAVDRLVHELGVPAEEVNRIYREQLEMMKKSVTAQTFLPIMVSRAVKERLAQHR